MESRANAVGENRQTEGTPRGVNGNARGADGPPVPPELAALLAASSLAWASSGPASSNWGTLASAETRCWAVHG
jgi:hypothetical protein